MLVNITLEDFKLYFNRDFPFGSNIEENVLDSDVIRAIGEAAALINQRLFLSQGEYTVGLQNLTAHILIVNLKNSSGGLCSTFQWPANSRSVGGVSESVTIPDSVMKSPFLASLLSTGYGAKYLAQIWSLTRGSVFSVSGATTA